MMDAIETFQKILKQTKLVKKALEADKIEIAIEALNDRKGMMDAFLKIPDKSDEKLKMLIEVYKMENDECIKLMRTLKDKLEIEFNKMKVQKRDVHRANLVNRQYKVADAFLVGNKFDSNKKF